MAVKLNIIDVSAWDSIFDWEKVADAVDGVIIRAGYRGADGGLTTDEQFHRNILGAIRAEIQRIGVYWWSTQHTVLQAKEDADYLLQLIEPYRESIQFGVWLDSEGPGSDTSGSNGNAFLKLSAACRTGCALTFLAAIQEAGYQPGVYASDSWFAERLVCAELNGYPLWDAKYGTVPPELVKHYAAWQYTSNGKVAGIKNNVDQSWFYTDLLTERCFSQQALMDAR